VPDCDVKYILFQRTDYLCLPKSIFIKILERLSPWSLYKSIVTLESTFRKEKVKNLFVEEMNREYEVIKPFLPQKCSKILDIGCGVCGIDVLLYRHYNCDESLEFYLLDKTDITKKIYYGFKKEAAFYNSFEAAQKLLCNNGIQKSRLHFIEASPDFHTFVNTKIDLVISLLSWGYHFPVSTYLHQVHNIMSRGRHLILDIRKETEGKKELEAKFPNVKIISEGEKYIRVLAIK
jgi:SAM-dependent methyltransferase